MKKNLKRLLLVICLIMFVYSGYQIYKYIQEKNASNDINDKLVQKAITKNNNPDEQKENQTNLPIDIDFSILKQENNDIVGWIYSENTPINYPVVQSNDNQYYLRRLINGEYNRSGTIFMDYRNSNKLEDNNTILYGHNMKSDSMFGTLQKYKNQSYYEEHKNMYYFTQEEKYVIKLFAGCTVSTDSDIYNLSSIDIEKFLQKSDFKSDIDITKNDKIITLSTCAYENENARYILMGVLRKE